MKNVILSGVCDLKLAVSCYIVYKQINEMNENGM